MSGFPRRPTRVAFGPTMENVRAPSNPKTDLGADQMNLTFWQAAGAGRVLPQAYILYNGVGGTPAILSQALAFDPRSILSNIDSAKTATGVYEFTFASTYKDEVGADVAFVPQSAIAFVQGTLVTLSAVCEVNGQIVTVRIKDESDVASDAKFLLFVW